MNLCDRCCEEYPNEEIITWDLLPQYELCIPCLHNYDQCFEMFFHDWMNKHNNVEMTNDRTT